MIIIRKIQQQNEILLKFYVPNNSFTILSAPLIKPTKTSILKIISPIYFHKDKTFIGMKSTAHYAENLINFLYTRGFQICVINPIQTSVLRKSNIRKTKTDSVDTFLIIKALTLNHYRLFSKRDYDSLQLKNLCRFRQKLMKARTKVKIQLVSYVDLVFPELQYSSNRVYTRRLVMHFSKMYKVPTGLLLCISQGSLTFYISPLRDTLNSLKLYI